jgi:hypothetical protein
MERYMEEEEEEEEEAATLSPNAGAGKLYPHGHGSMWILD